MEKVKIKSVQGDGHFDNDYGRMYKWEIELEDGRTGQANTKEQVQTKWVAGQEVWITVTPNGKFNPKFKLEKPPQESAPPAQSNSFQKDPLTQRLIISQSSLERSIEYHKGADGVLKANLSEIKTTAKELFDWVISNSQA